MQRFRFVREVLGSTFGGYSFVTRAIVAVAAMAALLLAAAGSAQADIVFVTSPNPTGDLYSSGAATAMSGTAFNVGSTANVLLVGVTLRGPASDPATLYWNPTGGTQQALTKLVETSNAGTIRSQAWYYLYSPGIGTGAGAGTISSTAFTGATFVGVSALSLGGVDISTAPLTTSVSNLDQVSRQTVTTPALNVPNANSWAFALELTNNDLNGATFTGFNMAATVGGIASGTPQSLWLDTNGVAPINQNTNNGAYVIQNLTTGSNVFTGSIFNTGGTNYTRNQLAVAVFSPLNFAGADWTGAVSGDISASGNYSGAISSTSDLRFFAQNITNPPSSNTTNGLSVAGLIFDNAKNPGSAVNISSTNSLVLGSDGIANRALQPVTLALPITLNAAQTWSNNSVNLLTVSGNITNGSNLLTVGGTNDITISGVLGSGSGGLTKSGVGTLTLSNANNYTGPTTVSSGTLAISGSVSGTAITINGSTLNASATNALTGSTSLIITSGTATLSLANDYTGGTTVNGGTLSLIGAGSSNTGTGPVAVNSGAILTGGGIIGGNLTVASAAKVLPHATPTGTATLTVGGNLALNPNSLLNFNFGTASGSSTPGASDQLLTSGALTANAPALNIAAQSGFGAGRYKVLGYGSLPGGFSPLTLVMGSNSGSSSYTYSLVNNSSSNQIDLEVYNSSVTKTWTGSADLSSWNTITANWAGGLTYSNGNPAAYQLADTPVFTTGAAAGNINVVGTISPAAMIFSATDQAFTFSGDPINSSGGLKSTATQPVTFNVPLNLTASQTWTNNGTGLITAANAIDTTSGGAYTLTVGGTGNTLISGVVGGGGGITKTGLGTLTLSNSNNYTGSTTAAGGTLAIDFSQPGAPPVNIVSNSSGLVLSGGALKVIGFSSGNTQTFNGTTIKTGASSLIDTNNGVNVLVELNAIARNPGGTVDFTQPTGTIGAGNGFTTSTANTSNGILGGWATVGGTSWATNNGTNIVALPAGSYTNTNTATPPSTAAWGTAGTANIDVTENSVQSSAVAVNSIRFSGNGYGHGYSVTLATGTTNTITSGGVLLNNTLNGGVPTITGGTLQSGNGQDLILINNNLNYTLAVNSVVQDNGSATALTVAGAGRGVVLGAANTLSGPLYVTGGNLFLNSPTGGNAWGNATQVYVGGSSPNSSTYAGLYFGSPSLTGDPTVTTVPLNVNFLPGGPSNVTLGCDTRGAASTWSGTLTMGSNITLNVKSEWGGYQGMYITGPMNEAGGSYGITTSSTVNAYNVIFIPTTTPKNFSGPINVNTGFLDFRYWLTSATTTPQTAQFNYNNPAHTGTDDSTIVLNGGGIKGGGFVFDTNAAAGSTANLQVTYAGPFTVTGVGGGLYSVQSKQNIYTNNYFTGPIALGAPLTIGQFAVQYDIYARSDGNGTLDRGLSTGLSAHYQGTVTIDNSTRAVNRAIYVVDTSGPAPTLDSVIQDGAGPVRNPMVFGFVGAGGAQITGNSTYTGGSLFAATTPGGYWDATSTAVLGTGDVRLLLGGALRLNAASNLGTNALVHVATSANGVGTGVLALTSTSLNPTTLLSSDSGGVLALDTTYSTALNMANVGNGYMFLGSMTSGTYSAATLGANSDGAYRLGGGGHSSTAVNVLTISNNVMASGNVIVGQVGGTSTNVNPGGGTILLPYGNLNGQGTVKLNAAQNTTGTITVNGGSLGGGTNNAGSSTILEAVVQNGVQPFGGGNNNVILNGGALQFDGIAGTAQAVTIGDLNVNGGPATLTVNTTSPTTVSTYTINGWNGLVRSNNSTFYVNATGTANVLGTSSKVFVTNNTNGSVNVNNNMVAPWITDLNGNFLTYGANGFAPAVYTIAGAPGNGTLGSGTVGMNNAIPTDIVQMSTGTADSTLTGPKTIYALRLAAAGQAIQAGANGPIALTIASGGLSVYAAGTNTSTIGSVTPANAIDVYFGTGGASEANIYVWRADTFLSLPNMITASSLTKSGPGTLSLYSGTYCYSTTSGNPNPIAGNVTINEGTVQTMNQKSLGNGSVVLNGGQWRVYNDPDIDNTIRTNILMGAVGGAFNVTNNNDGNPLSKNYGGSIMDATLPYGVPAGPLTIEVSSGTLTFTNATAGTNQWSGGTVIVNSGINVNSGAVGITGQVVVQNNVALGTGDVHVVSNGLTLTLQGNGNVNSNATLSLNAGTTAAFQSAGPTIGALQGAGSVVLGTSSVATTLDVGGNNRSTDFYGNISQTSLSQPGALTKSGTGRLTLAGGSTYTGTTTLSGGVLNVGGAEIPGTSGPLGKSAASNPGSIVFNGGTLQYSGANTFDYSGRFTTSLTQDYKVDTNGQNVTWATALAPLFGTGTLTKSGAGTLTLPVAETYSGATAVNGGTLSVTGSIASTSGVTVVPSAVLNLANVGGTALAPSGTYTPVANDGTMNVSSLSEKAGAISGAGSTSVLASASLTADSIVQNTLSIGAGGTVTIRETTGGSANTVPEPGTWVLIGTALLGWLTFRRRNR